MSERVFLGREEILAADDLQLEEVEVPEWGTWVRVRVMSGLDRDAFGSWIRRHEGDEIENFRAHLVALTVVGPEGGRLFSETDVPALGAKSGEALDRIYQVACRLNGLLVKNVEALKGESEPGRNDASASPSRSASA